MLSIISENPQSSLHIKGESKFFSKLLSKETSQSNNSFRVYYGVASGSVPFVWESEPGTPKVTFPTKSKTCTPITPPPSYYNFHPASKKSKYFPFDRVASFFRKLGRPRELRTPHRSSAPSSSSFTNNVCSSCSQSVRSYDGLNDNDDDDASSLRPALFSRVCRTPRMIFFRNDKGKKLF